jgi:CRP-like cAMP-binding protein
MSLYSGLNEPRPKGADEFLASQSLFEGVDEQALARVAAVLQKRNYGAGVTLYHQDMPSVMLYMLGEGSVRIFSIGRTGQEFTMGVLGSGDIFGELSVLDTQPHSATSVTLAPTTVWLLGRNHFLAFLREMPPLYHNLTLILARRIRASNQLLEAMTFQDVLGRLALHLLNLAQRYGRQTKAGIEISVPLTQGDLATMVGATRESVNKSFAVLRARALADAEGSAITVLSPDGLRDLIYERGR